MGEKWDERKEMKKRWGEKTAGIEIDGGGGNKKMRGREEKDTQKDLKVRADDYLTKNHLK